jgi:protein TonB
MAVWASLPSDPVVINQQIVQVSFVAPSSERQQLRTDSSSDLAVNLNKKPALTQKKQEQQKSEADSKQASAEKKTSGIEDPNATALKSAESEPVFDAAYLNNSAPDYPSTAKLQGIQGKVLLNVLVTAEGNASRVTITSSSGSKLLDSAALDAVKNWKFAPARRSGKAVEANVIVPIEFKII